MDIGHEQQIKDFIWWEGVGVEPTQDLSQPRIGFEDQFVLYAPDLPLRPVLYGVEVLKGYH